MVKLLRPISNNTINAALRRIGFSNEQHTGHRFRTTASTLLNEQGWNPDLIELQLAHAERNKVRSAYNRAGRLAERRTMMQAWADYLDALKAGSSTFCAQELKAAMREGAMARRRHQGATFRFTIGADRSKPSSEAAA